MINEGENYTIRNQFKFPQNITVQDCRDAIKGVQGFRETVRNEVICFNYDYCHRDTFPDPKKEGDDKISFLYKVRRECRGILFDQKTGKLLCRKFHKFFNVDEKDETSQKYIDLNLPFIMMEKLDGSLIAPIYHEDKIQWGSKSGLTDLGTRIDQFKTRNQKFKYDEFSEYWIKRDFTPMYEWCSDRNQIVLFYSEEFLSLTSLRNMITGEYLPYDDMLKSALEYNIPIVKKVEIDKHAAFSTCKTVGDMLKQVNLMKDIEGYIIRFENGNIFKLKCEWYFNLAHSQINCNNLSLEKDIWLLLLSKQFDDYLAKLAITGPFPSRAKAIDLFNKDLFTRIDKISLDIISIIKKLKTEGKVRKHITNDKLIEQNHKKYIFTFYDSIEEKDSNDEHLSKVSKYIAEHLKTLCSSKSKLDEAKQILGGDIIFDEDFYLNIINTQTLSVNEITK